MFPGLLLFSLYAAVPIFASQHQFHHSADNDNSLSHPANISGASTDPVPLSIRERWMRRAMDALSELKTPCQFAAFGTAVVNHTDSVEGELVCIGANSVREEGNPSLHGEIAGIRNCTAVLTSQSGPFKLSPSDAIAAFKQLSLYTTAEACPMCASAIRYSMFAEYIYATSSPKLIELGWPQIEIRSREVFERSTMFKSPVRIVGGVLANETDGLFGWQFQDGKCPQGSGCVKDGQGMCFLPDNAHKEL